MLERRVHNDSQESEALSRYLPFRDDVPICCNTHISNEVVFRVPKLIQVIAYEIIPLLNLLLLLNPLEDGACLNVSIQALRMLILHHSHADKLPGLFLRSYHLWVLP